MRTHYGKATWETEFTQYPFFWSQNENAKVNFSFSLHSSFLSFGLFLLRFKTTYYFPPFKSEKEITKSSVGKGKLSIKRAEYPKAEAWFIAPACRRFILRVVKGKISTSLHNLLSKLMKFLVKRYYCHVSNWKKKSTKLHFNKYIPVFEVVQFIDGDQDFDKSRLEKSKDHMFPSTESISHVFSITTDNWLQMAAGKSQFSSKIEIAVLILKVPFDFCLLIPLQNRQRRNFWQPIYNLEFLWHFGKTVQA